MRLGAFEINEPLPELQDPHVIAVLRPWINVGRVGTLALSRLEQHFGAKDLGQLARPGAFYDFTRYRPRTRFVNGKRVLNIPNTFLKYAQREDGHDLLFLHMREPHYLGEDYSESIIEVMKHFQARRYCLIGGMYDVVPHTRDLLVSGSGTSPDPETQLEGLGVRSSRYEGPTTITYMVTQETERMGMQNMTLIARLPQYVQLEEDHAGTAKLLELLSSFYPLPPDLADVDKGRRQYQELTAAVEQNPEVKQVLSQLEAQYDAQESTSSATTSAADVPLSPELESFLRGLEQDLGNDSA